MLTDAHCHPFDLAGHFPAAEDQRRQLGVMCAASSTTMEEFNYNEELARKAKEDGAAPILTCFAIHPQMHVEMKNSVQDSLAALTSLADRGRLSAIGETGFDLYNAALKETEKAQEEIFAVHLETALRYHLPLVIHARRAMHKIFAYSKQLKKCAAVIFHSWPGTAGEGESLLKRGINAFFSFGTPIMLNHREAAHCCAVFPADRLLSETDAPFQSLKGSTFSSYADLRRILEAIASLRGEAVDKMERIIEGNFYAALGKK